MAKQVKSYRYELLRRDDADFIVYQHEAGEGGWRTVSIWMIPQTARR